MATHRPPDIPPDNISLTDRAYYAIRDRLLRGELRLGMPVSSRRFAEELGMSHLAGGDEAAADQAMRAHIRYGVEERVRNIRSGIPSEWRGRRSHADR